MRDLHTALRQRLRALLPGELQSNELRALLSPGSHMLLLTQRRATLIVNRVRLFAFLFALLTPLWSLIDLLVFPYPLWMNLAILRILVCLAFACVLVFYRPSGDMPDAYRSIAILFAIPTVFYICSHTLLGSYQLAELSAAVGAGYAFLPFVLMAGLAIFPLTLVENLIMAGVLLLAHAFAGYLSWSTLNWPSFAGAFWLLVLIAGVTALACTSQLAFLIALVRQAVRDPLTGVLSRGSGQEILELQWAHAQRHNAPLALAFIDLDHFKQINDQFGHEAGDQALIQAAEQLRTGMRASDVLVRWGGEEFLLIMPDTPCQAARLALSRLLSTGLGIRPDGQRLTASMGLAERCQDQPANAAELLASADQRMYRAKQAGRNQLCLAS